jgi:hypothetical protein
LIILLGSLLPFAVQALTLPVNQDAAISSSQTSKSNGVGSKLPVNAKDSVLLAFSYGSVPAGITSAEVATATLRLWVNTKKASTGDTLKIYSLPAGWDEHTVTSATAPAIGSLITSVPVANVTLGNWLEVDVSAMLKIYLDNPSTAPAAILIQAGSLASKAVVAFDSKENSATGHPAWIDLELVHSGPKGDAGAAGANGLSYSPQQIALLRWYEANQAGNNFATGIRPRGIAFDGANIWVTNQDSGNVSKLNATDGSLVGTYTAGIVPGEIAFDGANIWVTDVVANKLTKLKASNGSLAGSYSVETGPHAVAFDGTNIWVTHDGTSHVSKHNTSDGSLVGTYEVGANPNGVAFDGANIWVVNQGSNTVTKLKASDGSLVGTYAVGSYPSGVAFDGASIWVTNSDSNNVTKLKASDGSLIGTYGVETNPLGIAFDGSHIWVVNQGSNTVTKLKASDGSLVGTYSVGNLPSAIAFDGVNIWVTNMYSNNVSKL